MALLAIEVNYLAFDIREEVWLVTLKVIGSFLDSQLVEYFHHILDHQEISYWPKH